MLEQTIAVDVALITGGAGFLGRALIRELKKGNVLPVPREIRVLDPEAGALPPQDGVTAIPGDVRDPEAVGRACEGADVVFHCAALVDWGRMPDELLRAVNVDGTGNVIDACREAGVGLVHTSTLDVVYRGEPIEDGDESLPYPPRHVNAYCETKAEAERAVLDAKGLRAAVIRPCSIFGEHDPYHVPPLIEMARRRMLFRVGSGRSRSQHVYVGNVAHAHLLAARSLLEPEGRAAGQVYFVTDFPAENFFDFLEPIIEGAGYRMLPRWLSVPRPLMYGLACALEGTAKVVAPLHRFTPTITRFAVDFVCLDFTFVSKKAERELGYRPVYGEEEAFTRTIDYFRGRYQLRSR
jgi:nucleoside-diphosphate-sugar epimerase